MKVILVEKDRTVISSIKSVLSTSQFQIQCCYRTDEVVDLLSSQYCTLLIIEPALAEGLSLRRLRKISLNRNPMILVITKLVSLTARIKYFEEGCDDFMVKPFFPAEVKARVERLLTYRKVVTSDQNIILLSEFLFLDLSKQILFDEGVLINLTPMEAELLRILGFAEDFVTYEALIYELSEIFEREVSLDCLRMLVLRLRKKLKNEMGRYVVETVKGKGYGVKR